jgi:hypothetical protein
MRSISKMFQRSRFRFGKRRHEFRRELLRFGVNRLLSLYQKAHEIQNAKLSRLQGYVTIVPCPTPYPDR